MRTCCQFTARVLVLVAIQFSGQNVAVLISAVWRQKRRMGKKRKRKKKKKKKKKKKNKK